jgi:hypothetical protein
MLDIAELERADRHFVLIRGIVAGLERTRHDSPGVWNAKENVVSGLVFGHT